jgi:hypothetical protein
VHLAQLLETLGIDNELDELFAVESDLKLPHSVAPSPAARHNANQFGPFSRNCHRDCPWIGSAAKNARDRGGAEQR